MAKKINTDSLIHVELEKLEKKVKEFQTYLELNSILYSGTTRMDEDNEVDQDKLHKEIVVQIKMQDALFVWLPLLDKLKAGEQGKELETRGNIEVNGLYKRRKNAE